MSKPVSPDHGVSFDLASVERALRGEEAYARDGHTARTMIRQPDLRVVMMVIKAGKRIAEHRTNDTASIQVVRGRVRLRLPESVVELGAGQLLVLERGLPHDVEAETDSALLLTLGWHAKPGAP